MQNWRWWGGESLKGGPAAPIAFDTETAMMVTPIDIPPVALAMAYDGETLVLIHPNRIESFLLAHKDQHLVGHNLAYDWWVCHETITPSARRVLWDMADRSQFHDSMLLDDLVRLATVGLCHHRDLGEVSAEYLGQENRADKESPYRTRFGEFVGLSPNEMMGHPEFQGFIEYALSDVIVTWNLYQKIHAKALAITQEFKTETRWGLLTEQIQVRASISFAHLGRQPIHIDVDKQREMERVARDRASGLIERLERECPGLWKRDREGQFKLTPKTGLPQMDFLLLQQYLTDLARDFNLPLIRSEGKQKRVSVAPSAWAAVKDRDPSGFLSLWVEFEGIAKQLEFLVAIRAEKVWSKYNVLMKTGRTSAASHKHVDVPGVNIQQIPRDSEMRSLFIPAGGKRWASIDYSYIELRTLAATCEKWYGKSALAVAVKEHTAAVKAGRSDVPDPHQRTGAGLLGVTVAEFLKLPKEEQKLWRQRAKPVNFGYPGGLGTARFVDYAGGEYGLSVTTDEAKAFKKAWLATYPEMNRHLEDDTATCLARASGLPTTFARQIVGPSSWNFRETLQGVRVGQKVWDRLDQVLDRMDPEFAELVRDRNGDEIGLRLWRARRAFTITGRIRAGVNYTDAKNTPFQGLAADGAKEALFQLLRRGYRVIAFVHDEICCEICSDIDLTRIRAIMDAEMEKVLGGLPSMTEGKSSTCWSK